MARKTRELAQRPTVDPHDEPSVEWGWHGGFPRGMMIAGWAVVVILLLFTIGNHEGHIEDIWLVATAVVIAFSLVMRTIRKRHAWRR